MTRWILSATLAALTIAGCNTGGGNEGVLPGVQALVFAKRAFITETGDHNVAGGNANSFDYLRYQPGGGLYVLTPPTPSGELRNLTEGFRDVDVSGLDVSFDGTQVVFSMRRAGTDNFHIYVANIDGTGDIRQLTFGNADDAIPIFVPGDRVAFVTNEGYTAMGTRADEYNHSRIVSQLATVSLANGDADRVVCSQNLSHTAEPFLMQDGRVGYSRWEHLGGTNDVKLFAMNPDCTGMVAIAGQHGKPANSLVQTTEVEAGIFVTIGMDRTGTIQAGALLRVDSRSRAGSSSIALDEQTATIENLTPAVPTDRSSPPSGVGRYRNPRALLSGGRILVSWSNGDVNGRNVLAGTAPNFGVYLFDPETRERTLVYDDPNTWDLYATPVRERVIPPVRGETVVTELAPDVPAIIGTVNVAATSLSESVSGSTLDGMELADALNQTHRVRIIEGFSTEIGPIRNFGLTSHEGAAILDEVRVLPDGSWEAAVPPYLPYHLQALDEFGMSIRSENLWIQAMPGENRRCGGCHEGRAQVVLPRMGATTLAQQAGAVDANFAIPDRMEIPWMGASSGNLQDVFDAHCVSCHSGGAGDPFAGRVITMTYTDPDTMMVQTFQIPYLDLSGRPITLAYREEVVTYPASYVSLVYAANAEVVANESIELSGELRDWVVGGSARTSDLIIKVNAESEVDPSIHAFPGALHPEDVGGSMTREERMMIIRMADLGAQYWSRQNVEGADMWRTAGY